MREGERNFQKGTWKARETGQQRSVNGRRKGPLEKKNGREGKANGRINKEKGVAGLAILGRFGTPILRRRKREGEQERGNESPAEGFSFTEKMCMGRNDNRGGEGHWMLVKRSARFLERERGEMEYLE